MNKFLIRVFSADGVTQCWAGANVYYGHRERELHTDRDALQPMDKAEADDMADFLEKSWWLGRHSYEFVVEEV